MVTKEQIAQAVISLDADNDEHWTKSGLPAMGEVEKLVGDTSIVRAQVDEAMPGYTRGVAKKQQKEEKEVSVVHASDCSMHNAPAEKAGECDCGVVYKTPDFVKLGMDGGKWAGECAKMLRVLGLDADQQVEAVLQGWFETALQAAYNRGVRDVETTFGSTVAKNPHPTTKSPHPTLGTKDVGSLPTLDELNRR